MSIIVITTGGQHLTMTKPQRDTSPQRSLLSIICYHRRTDLYPDHRLWSNSVDFKTKAQSREKHASKCSISWISKEQADYPIVSGKNINSVSFLYDSTYCSFVLHNFSMAVGHPTYLLFSSGDPVCCAVHGTFVER